jgi:hypothetical protein
MNGKIDRLALPELISAPHPACISLQSALFHHGLIAIFASDPDDNSKPLNSSGGIRWKEIVPCPNLQFRGGSSGSA